MTLGLKRGEVTLVPHQPEWATQFNEEKHRLAATLGPAALAIEHIGSTAVPDLLAKPILDIAILVHSFDDIATWPDLLHPQGYTSFGDRDGRGDHFFAKGPDECRTIYLHVVTKSDVHWQNYLNFRGLLRSQPIARRKYEQLKQAAHKLHPTDRQAYTTAKQSLIQHLLVAATRKESGRPRPD